MHNPRLSVSLPYWQDRDPLDALLVAEAADKLGFDRLWIGEMATFDAFALATAIGQAPGRIPLCIGPLAVAVRSPATIAMGVASVAALTGRPVDIALGTSSTVVVRDWHGRERQRTAVHLEESARIVRRLLDGEKADFDGTAERIRGYRLRLPGLAVAKAESGVPPATSAGEQRVGTVPSESAQVPSAIPMSAGYPVVSLPSEPETAVPRYEVVVAAFGERALAAAARTADRVVLNLVTPAQVARCASAVKEFAAEAGRPVPAISVWVTAAADPSAEMLTTVRRGVVGYLRAPGYDAMFTEAGFGDVVRLAQQGGHPREVLAAIPDELAATVGMFGDAATLAARLSAYRAAGADEIVVVPVTSAEDPAAYRTLQTLARIDHG
ncbi:LLM class flavin-dependent oxidoreductase [Nocardia sp. NPDC006630]|uniref:LLM class flavin-dependent oxidoreductase n=1 Tax=Nocardia sp. NPDC006630 TaxID=3157181 RepID=UPI0033BEE87B